MRQGKQVYTVGEDRMSRQERHIKLPKEPQEAIDTLERFVVRARRIEAHSLVKSKKVKELAQPSYTLRFNDSTVSMRLNSRPEDEEIFESLAARIRPCIVDSEPIQLEKVVAAIRVLTSTVELDERQSKLLELVNSWCKEHIAPHSYNAISSHEEIGELNSDKVTSASDTLLGLGWYYADLVHADPRQEKEAALEFPYDFRYNQGVVLVSHLALIISSLLKLIREISDVSELGLSPEVWTSQVTAGGGPFEFGVGKVYVGPAGFVPSTGAAMDEIPGFKELDLVTARRMQDPGCAVDARFVNDSGEVIETHDGFYIIDTEHNCVVISIEDKILLSGSPEEGSSPVGELPFEQAFFSKAAGPVDGKTEQFLEFLAKAKAAGKIEISMSWRGTPIQGTVTFPKAPSNGKERPTDESA